jgi:hypothetical protein
MRWTGIEPWDLNDDGRDGLDAERETHRLASEAAYEWLDKQTARVRRHMHVLSVRCPTRGCLLSEVYKFPLRRSGERYLARCMTTRITTVEILNWAFSDDWHGPTVWYPISCRHGNGKIERAWLLDIAGLREGWRHAMRTVEEERARAPQADHHGIKSGVFHPVPKLWESKS